jgi:phospho-N-acetylmuramoyl-pentapeptide-transferase
MIMTLSALLLPLYELNEVMPHNGDENMAVSLALAALSFMVTIIIGRPLITWLRQHGIGKKIRLELTQHMDKAGTPTMGGIMFTSSAVVMTLVFNTVGRLSMLLPIGVLIAVSTLGAIDDAMNLVNGDKEGMSGRFKMLWLVVIAIIAAFVLHLPDPWGLGLHHMYIPYFGRFDIGWIYLPIAAFAVVGMANAVNLTDGLDSLAAGTAAIAFVSYGIIAYQQGQTAVVTFCFIMVGSLMGFLWFNAPPAQVFMGDTGSLATGAALAVAAFMTGQWLLLPVVGGVFVAETLSVMIQSSYFKYTRKKTGEGKRFFRMAPIHHHFEGMGWSRTQIATRFWLVGMMAGLLGCALALM